MATFTYRYSCDHTHSIISCVIHKDGEEPTLSLPFRCVLCDPNTEYAQKWHQHMKAGKKYGRGCVVTDSGNILSGLVRGRKGMLQMPSIEWKDEGLSIEWKVEGYTKLTSLPTPADTEITKCVAKFQNGRQCTYNAKPGRTTCDRPGHSDWENLDTSNSSALEKA